MIHPTRLLPDPYIPQKGLSSLIHSIYSSCLVIFILKRHVETKNKCSRLGIIVIVDPKGLNTINRQIGVDFGIKTAVICQYKQILSRDSQSDIFDDTCPRQGLG